MAKTTNNKFELIEPGETAYSQFVAEANANWQAADANLKAIEEDVSLLQGGAYTFDVGVINATYQKTITFDKPYPNAPVAFAQAYGVLPSTTIVWVDNVTTGSCRLNIMLTANPGQRTVYWHAQARS